VAGVARTASYAYDDRTRARSADGPGSWHPPGRHRTAAKARRGGDEVERSSSSPLRLTEPPSASPVAESAAVSRVRRLRRD